MKARIDHILAKYYDIKLNKYIAWCRVKKDGKYKYQRIFFPDADAWKTLREGDFVNEE